MLAIRAFLRPFSVSLALLGLLILTACTAPPQDVASRAEATRLGTQWGEGVQSNVSTLRLARQSQRPVSLTSLPYSAAQGRGEVMREMALANGRVGLRVLKENGDAWPIYRRAGTLNLQGQRGECYALEYRNFSRTQTFEIVATVDGLDVINGQPGSLKNRGYVLRPGERVQIKGFRKSGSEVAAFRFSDPADAYVANSRAGSIGNVGVIGTAIFDLSVPAPVCGREPCAFPAEGQNAGYAPPPSYGG